MPPAVSLTSIHKAELADAWKVQVAPRLLPVLERHHRNLAALVVSLEAAGHPEPMIVACVRDLLATHEADLMQALAAPGPPR